MLINKRGRPLLDYALRPNLLGPGSKFLPSDIDLAAVLLSHGADSNREYLGGTVWSEVLFHLYDRVSETERSQSIGLWKRAARLLIQHGAKAGMRDLEIIQTLFEKNRYHDSKKHAPRKAKGTLTPIF